MGAARLLSHFGAKVLVSELDTDRFTAEKRSILAEINAEFEFGYHSQDVLDSDFVVVSPGIPENVDILQKLRAKNIPIYSEIEISSWFMDAPIIAVTGSNGKTTTVNLIHHLLVTAGYDSFLGGNVGIAASDIVLEKLNSNPSKPVYVLEVSSFQLDHIESFKPQVAVILNLTPDHLDRYQSLNDYYESKLGMFRNLDADCVAVLNRDDAELSAREFKVPCMRYFSIDNLAGGSAMLAEGVLGTMRDQGWSSILPAKALPLPGKHNLSNALAAIAATMDFIDDPGLLAQGLMTFEPVPHRIEYVGQIKGIRCYNDSKATNIASTEVAVSSFNQPLWLILGGKDKGGDFNALIPLLEVHTKEVLLIGSASETIFNQIGNTIPTQQVETLDKALAHCLEHGDSGDVLLLSPACASFDQFKNYEDRGDQFRSLVHSQEGWTQ